MTTLSNEQLVTELEQELEFIIQHGFHSNAALVLSAVAATSYFPSQQQTFLSDIGDYESQTPALPSVHQPCQSTSKSYQLSTPKSYQVVV
jgi:hypothetical protein